MSNHQEEKEKLSLNDLDFFLLYKKFVKVIYYIITYLNMTASICVKKSRQLGFNPSSSFSVIKQDIKWPAFSFAGNLFLQLSIISLSLEHSTSIWFRKIGLVVKFSLKTHKTCSQVSVRASNCSGGRFWAQVKAAKSFSRSIFVIPQLKRI